MQKVLFSATVDSHILAFHIPYLKFFKESGYEVHVATNSDLDIPYCDVKHKISFERNPLKFNNLKAIKSLKKIILKEKFDIIHTHTPMGSVITRIASMKSRKKYNTRVIYTAHGFHFYKGASRLNWLLYYPIEKFLAKFTDDLITINKEDYNLAKKKFKTNVYYVPGVGVDRKKFDIFLNDLEKISLRKSLGLKKNDFVMIFPAEISKRKRQIWLIETLSSVLDEHSDMHLLLPGVDSLDGKCHKLVDSLNLNRQVHFLGFRNDIAKLFNISNVSLSSSFQEGLPVNLMEAMYKGLPIVASNCRGNRDLVKNNINGFVIDLNDRDGFKKSILKIYNGEVNLDKIKVVDKKLIKRYLLDNVLKEVVKIYNIK